MFEYNLHFLVYSVRIDVLLEKSTISHTPYVDITIISMYNAYQLFL